MSTTLSDCGIDDALIEFIPCGEDTFLQLTDVLHVVTFSCITDQILLFICLLD